MSRKCERKNPIREIEYSHCCDCLANYLCEEYQTYCKERVIAVEKVSKYLEKTKKETR